jgi:hypothetical protein
MIEKDKIVTRLTTKLLSVGNPENALKWALALKEVLIAASIEKDAAEKERRRI